MLFYLSNILTMQQICVNGSISCAHYSILVTVSRMLGGNGHNTEHIADQLRVAVEKVRMITAGSGRNGGILCFTCLLTEHEIVLFQSHFARLPHIQCNDKYKLKGYLDMAVLTQQHLPPAVLAQMNSTLLGL